MISIVIPTIQGRELSLERCLAGYRTTTPEPFEIIVVRNQKACGIAWGIGAQQAVGDYVHFTADDLVPHNGWAEAAMTAVDSGVLPAARVILDGQPLICPVYLQPRFENVPNVLVPFFNRTLWELGQWVVPIHYGSDDWITYQAVMRGIAVEHTEAYAFTHEPAVEGRLWMNRHHDVPQLCSFMEEKGFVPHVYGQLATEMGWAGWVG